jgi:acyl-homoserine lactone acylase PvdQ
VKEETPELVDWTGVDEMNQIPNWKGAIPYSAYPQKYNPHDKRCEEFVK